ncbi:hypothetical protein YC2023_123283 [Brassica napus]
MYHLAKIPSSPLDFVSTDDTRGSPTTASLAQLLKACGTTPATPVKLRNASENLETPNVENNLHLPSLILGSPVTLMSDAVFHLDEKTPEAYGEEVSEQTPSSCITDSQNSAKISTGYSHAREESQGSIGAAFMDGVDITTKLPLTATGKRKSVRFECDFDQSYLYIGLGCHYYGNERAQVRI